MRWMQQGRLDGLLATGMIKEFLMSVFKAAAIQMRSGIDPKRNVADMEVLVREAAGKGAAYVQTPEMTGALVRDEEARATSFTTEEKDLVVAAASRLASELGIYFHIGSTAILRIDGKLANRAFLFGPDGSMIASYDKIHMFDVDLDNGESWRESSAYEAAPLPLLPTSVWPGLALPSATICGFRSFSAPRR